jgi:hypothetical protein
MNRTRLLLLMVASTIVVAACSGGDSTDGVASLENIDSPTNLQAEESSIDDDVDVEQAMLDFTQCLRDEGMDIEDPEVDADGQFGFRAMAESAGDVDRQELREAFETCQSELEGITLRGAGIDRTAIQDTLIEYAACMRDNGYDMEDPDLSSFGPGGGGGEGQPGEGGGPFGDIDPDDPNFVAANEVCQDIFTTGLPRFLGGGGQGPGGEG